MFILNKHDLFTYIDMILGLDMVKKFHIPSGDGTWPLYCMDPRPLLRIKYTGKIEIK